DVEPGTNPGFLYQQNTLRDALVAALGLNIFNNHARRIKMANIAQTVNVLQAMILTRENQMVKTPTFYVFKMYKVHQDAIHLPTEVASQNYENENGQIPALSVSASRDKNENVNITIANVDPNRNLPTSIEIPGMENWGTITASIITSDKMNALNDFGKEEQIHIQKFSDYKKNQSGIQVNIPSKSVVSLSVSSN
ncbi:MAG: alpha-L-arabinofuranosidase C-terminal domain-containing protein, partial [Eudoraea sp.]